MTTFQISSPFKPFNGGPVPQWELAYFQARNRSRVHELVLNEFKKSGLTQAELARRMNKRPDVVCRLIGAPGNWGLDTVSDLLFAISHAEVGYSTLYPLDGAARNYTHPSWLQPNSVVVPVSDTSGALKIVTYSSGTTNVVPDAGTVTRVAMRAS